MSKPFLFLSLKGAHVWAVAFLSLGILLPSAARGGTVRLHVTNVVSKAVTEVANKLKGEGIELKIHTEGGSSVGIAAVTNDQVDIAITIRHMTAQERSVAPEKRFVEEVIAFQALALVVPDDVWASGVRALSKDDMTRIYEGRAKNWKEFGGEDRAIKFYNPEQGIGVWEPFVTWLYDDTRKASLGANFEKVRSPEETRDSVEFTKGSLSVAPPRFADGKGVFALSVKDENGAQIPPTLEQLTSQRYPISRPIVAITAGRPTGEVRRVFEYLRSEEGLKAFEKIGLVPAPADAANP